MAGRGGQRRVEARGRERESVHLIGGDVERTCQSNASDGLKLLASRRGGGGGIGAPVCNACRVACLVGCTGHDQPCSCSTVRRPATTGPAGFRSAWPPAAAAAAALAADSASLREGLRVTCRGAHCLSLARLSCFA